jgi:hypothetical protein
LFDPVKPDHPVETERYAPLPAQGRGATNFGAGSLLPINDQESADLRQLGVENRSPNLGQPDLSFMRSSPVEHFAVDLNPEVTSSACHSWFGQTGQMLAAIMPKTLTANLREQVINAGTGRNAAARGHGVSQSSAIRWDIERCRTGAFEAISHCGVVRLHACRVASGSYEARDDSLEPISLVFLQPTRPVAETLDAHAIEQFRPDVLKNREHWLEGQRDLNPIDLILIDETRTTTKKGRTHRRCRWGERPFVGFPHVHRKKTTMVSGRKWRAWLHR